MSKTNRGGFSIVELLIVVSVLAILASIVLIAYNAVVSRAQETAVRHDISNIASQLKVESVFNRRFPTTAQLKTTGIHINKQTYGVNPVGATIFYCVTDDGLNFSIVARVKSSIVLAYLSTTDTVTNYTGSPTAPQLCIDSGLPGPTSNVNYQGFTENGSWYAWVL